MGRPPIKDGLDQFQIWLRQSEKKTLHTSRNYTTYVRKILLNTAQDYSNLVALTDYFESQTDNKFINMSKSAWKSYARYMKDAHDITVAEPFEAKGVATNKKIDVVQSLPTEVRQAINGLLGCGFTAADIACLMWIHVLWSDTTILKGEALVGIRHPVTGFMHRLALASLKDLLEYAKPGTNFGIPLVPAKPGSTLKCTSTFIMTQGMIFDMSVEEMAQQADAAIQEYEKKNHASFLSDEEALFREQEEAKEIELLLGTSNTEQGEYDEY